MVLGRRRQNRPDRQAVQVIISRTDAVTRFPRLRVKTSLTPFIGKCSVWGRLETPGGRDARTGDPPAPWVSACRVGTRQGYGSTLVEALSSAGDPTSMSAKIGAANTRAPLLALPRALSG